MVEMNVIIGDGHPTGSTNLVLPFQDSELNGPRDMTTDIPHFFCLRERFGYKENWTFMSKYPTRPVRIYFGQRKVFNQRPIRTIPQFPAGLTHCFNAFGPVNLLCPLLYRAFRYLLHSVACPVVGLSFRPSVTSFFDLTSNIEVHNFQILPLSITNDKNKVCNNAKVVTRI